MHKEFDVMTHFLVVIHRVSFIISNEFLHSMTVHDSRSAIFIQFSEDIRISSEDPRIFQIVLMISFDIR